MAAPERRFAVRMVCLGVCLAVSLLGGCAGEKDKDSKDAKKGSREVDLDRLALSAPDPKDDRRAWAKEKEVVKKSEKETISKDTAKEGGRLHDPNQRNRDEPAIDFPSPAGDSALPAASPRPLQPRRPEEGKPGEPAPEATKPPKPDQTPQVWRRDRSQPTFARVYVGDKNSLDLVSLQVSVTVQGPRARTVVDHIFRNPHPRQLEGTFEYPLPAGASPSYFAMFLGQTREDVPARFGPRGNTPALPDNALARLTPSELVRHIDSTSWGTLQEARVVGKEKALETYEEIVRGRIDPALLEYAGGNTFRGRVFPIPPKGYNRVILAYEELLPVSQERLLYRFPLPGVQLTEMRFTLQASAAECKEPRLEPANGRKDNDGDRLTFSRTWANEKPKGEVVFSCQPAEPRVQAVSGRHGENGPNYLYARLRPQVPAVEKEGAFASHAVFVLDTSLSEHPKRFDVNVQLLRRILENDPDIKHFNILTFNVGSAWLEPKGFLPNTPEGRQQVLARLDGLVLEGATDLSCALERLVRPGFDLPPGTPLNCFLLSDGDVNWGPGDAGSLVAGFERRCPFATRFHCYRTGLGAENLELFEALTRRSGGVFNCYGEADLKAAALAHRNHCLQVESVRLVGGPHKPGAPATGSPSVSDLLVAGRRAAVYPGGEVVLAARVAGAGLTTVVVEGKFQGRKVVEEFPIQVGSLGELAPRAWAEVAVASLLALNDPRFDSLVTAYCQQFGIVSRVASFLVLENEADYKRLNLEEERGKTLAGDLGPFLSAQWVARGQEVAARTALTRLLERVEPRLGRRPGAVPERPVDGRLARLLAALSDKDCEPPVAEMQGAVLTRADVPAAYLEDRQRDPAGLSAYLTEARRRAEKGDVDGAVRVLSSIIEEHAGRTDAQRLVGYRLLDLRQPAQASRLFQQVREQRPFEPHSYRDLARALEESGRFGLAAVNYEIVLAGQWHNRFGADLQVVAQEEYAHMMQDAIRRKAVAGGLLDYFGNRLETMKIPQSRGDLRVTITWNTDATDVDLWVIEPDGTKCFYQHQNTRNGGRLSQDQTRGYGPERYQIERAPKGVFRVLVHYFGTNPNLLGGETHVQVMVTRNAGSPQEVVQRHTVILKRHGEEVEVCKVEF